MKEIKTKIKLNRKQKQKLLNIATLSIITFILLITFNQAPRDWLRGQLNLPSTEERMVEDKPDMQIWKLTHLPKSAPKDSVIKEPKIINSLSSQSYQDVFNIAIEAIRHNSELKQITFEVDMDDNPKILSPTEAAALNSLEYLGLFSESGNKLAQAKFQKVDNQVLAIFKNPGIQLRKGEIASLAIRVKPLDAIIQDKKIRLQLTLKKTFATLATNEEAIIYADLGANNNSQLNDDLLASDMIQIR